MKNFLKGTVAAAALALSLGANAAVTIDLFNPDSNQVVTDSTIGAADFDPITGTGSGVWGGSPAGSTGIVGGQRDIYVGLTANPNGLSNPATAEVAGGVFTVSNKSQVSSTVAVRWDGLNDDPALAMGLSPLSFSVADSFNLNVIFSDLGFTFEIYMFTSADTYSKLTLTSNAHNVPAVTSLPIAAFLDCDNSVSGGITTCVNGGVVSNVDGTGVNLADVGALMVVIDPLGASTALDLTLDQITTSIPEPSSIGLAGLALLGAFGVARRRNQKA